MSKQRRIKTIADCCDILDNFRIPINDEVRQTLQGNVPYYGANGIQGYIDKFIFDEDLILLAEDGGNFEEYNTRPIAYKISGKSWVNNHAHILRAKENINQDYIFYSLVHKDITKYLNSGTRSKLNKSELKKIEIGLPETKNEEDKIAFILSTADAVIKETRAAIAKYKAIKQGMLQDLFTRGIDISTNKLRPRFEDAPHLYKESNLGMIPREWDEIPLEELTTQIGDGIHATPKYSQNTDYYFVNGNNLSDGDILIGSALSVSEEEFKKHFKELNDRTILYSINGTIGNIAIYKNEKVILGKSVCYITCKPNVNLDYIYFLLQTFQLNHYFDLELTASTIKNLSLSSVRNTPVTLPKTNSEQKLIAERIRIITSKLNTELTYLQKQQQIKKGLMEDLLTGIKLVKVAEELVTQYES
jgi:type I restriction enzyme S subunit